MAHSLADVMASAAGPLVGAAVDGASLASRGPRGEELAKLLDRCNGFFLFDHAVHVFPGSSKSRKIAIDRFNSQDGWRRDYWHGCDDLLFFGSDAFGSLFAMPTGGEHIVLFNPETGSWERWAEDFENWALRLTEDSYINSGYQAMKAWQDVHCPIEEGTRLLPRKGFVFGGKPTLSNLGAVDLVESLAYRGCVASQIRDLPDGATVQLRFE